MTRQKRDLLTLHDLDATEIIELFARAAELKRARQLGERTHTLTGKVLGMLFEKASTRTRVSFEVGMFELGGHAVYLGVQGTQVGRGEPMADTARVLGSYCHGIVIRTFGQERAQELAEYAPVPVINGLTDLVHPCQVLADLFTVHESLGDVRQVRYAWVGDGNNMANSWINAAGLLGLDLVLACPPDYEPNTELIRQARARIATLGRGRVEVIADPVQAVTEVDVVSTDVWASMGQESQAEERARVFADYCVDEALLARAAPDAVVLHCLPAHRGEEISAGVIEGPNSAVWRQAENRLHVQKALLERTLDPGPDSPGPAL
jgi:ornithine carbamoyltransferase